MDFQRIVLYVGLCAVSFFLWQAWQHDYPPQRQVAVTQQSTAAGGVSPSAHDVPALPVTAKKAATANVATHAYTKTSGKLIRVHTGVIDAVIDTAGGNLVRVELPKYPKDNKAAHIPFELLNNNHDSLYIAQSGLLSQAGPDTSHGQAVYTAKQGEYRLADGSKQLHVDLHWKAPNGLKVTKTYTFERDSYVMDVSYHIENQSQHDWQGYLYTQFKRRDLQQKGGGMFSTHSYFGGAISSPEKAYEKISFSDMNKAALSREIKGGWAAMLQHYFLGAWIPNAEQGYNYFTKVSEPHTYTLGMMSPAMDVPAGQSKTIGARLYTGPELPGQLKTIAPHLDLTVDYGFLWIFSSAIFWVMKHIHEIIGNWGWSIVLVTVLIKALFYKLSAKSYQSMANMRKLQPRIEALKERYGDDRQKMTQATMELYKKEKMNPLGSCLPIVVQIPVFLALYWVLLESVHLRQAPFIFWIHDLSTKDPFYILPVLMGISMFFQQKLNPPPPDPTQAKVMMFLPVIFTVLFMNFPAGLVLYWFVNNTLSLVQQWWIMKKFDVNGNGGKRLATT